MFVIWQNRRHAKNETSDVATYVKYCASCKCESIHDMVTFIVSISNLTGIVCNNDVSEAECLDAVKMSLESTWKTVFAAILLTIFENL